MELCNRGYLDSHTAAKTKYYNIPGKHKKSEKKKRERSKEKNTGKGAKTKGEQETEREEEQGEEDVLLRHNIFTTTRGRENRRGGKGQERSGFMVMVKKVAKVAQALFLS